MYFVEKVGVYGHGVFWIGNSVGDGVAAVDELSEQDRDAYHDWLLYEFVEQERPEHDADHRLIYEKRKGSEGKYA